MDAVGSYYTKQMTVRAVSLAVGQTARAAAVAKDGSGRPVHDILVSFRWSDGVTTNGYTDDTGKAVTTRLITKAGSYTLRARAESGGHTYTRYRDFSQR